MRRSGSPRGLLEVFGLKLDDVMDIKKRRGVDVQDNDIVIARTSASAARDRGRMTRVAVQGPARADVRGHENGKAARLAPSSSSARNYIYFGGGVITFGKLTMSDADRHRLIDNDPRDPFEFSPPGYLAQLVAGYSKTTQAKGLRTYMPDLNDLKKPQR